MRDRLSLGARRALCAWTFLAVPVVFYASVRLYPAADAFLMSLTDWNIVGQRRFIGLGNYRRLATDPAFWKVMGNTVQYLVLGVAVSLALAFLVAYHLDRVRVDRFGCRDRAAVKRHPVRAPVHDATATAAQCSRPPALGRLVAFHGLLLHGRTHGDNPASRSCFQDCGPASRSWPPVPPNNRGNPSGPSTSPVTGS